MGRGDLIRAAAANGSPNSAVGRPCKVSKEAIIGLVTAIELFLQDDHEAEWTRHLEEADRIRKAIAGIPNAPRASRRTARSGPHRRSCSRSIGGHGLTPTRHGGLRQGEPPIMVRVHRGDLLVDPHRLRGDEASVVARRLREEPLRRPARP